MRRIILLSDTHSDFDPKIPKYFENCDEIWHAGDVGDVSVIESMQKYLPVRGVYGNIDGADVRNIFPKNLRFNCEDVDVWITHIGGYPGRYSTDVLSVMRSNPPKLFICGHSHILKVMFDQTHQCLHMNPGACGSHGFHKIKTMLRFTIDGKDIRDLEVIELGKK